jgi:HEAT repeat protein
MTMLDDPDKEVATAAEQAVRSLGIPVGENAEARKQIIAQLRRKGREEFLRDWLINQEARMRTLEAESELWRQRYLSALDKIYDGITDDAARGQFLAGYLADPKEKVRLWVLDKVSQWRLGTKSEMPGELGLILIELVSDPDRDVRFKTARLLALMGQLNSSRRLLQQLEVEQDDEVKMELFIALGGACYYAFLPNSEIRIPDEIRKQTLQWAEVFLFEDEPKKAQEGAEVIKKLLEQDGLQPDEANRYLLMLAERYNRQPGGAEGALQAELLNAMAGLCAQSVNKAEAVRLFKPVFEQALSDDSALVREAAVDGLIYADKPRALKRLRMDLVNDKSAKVREKLLNLAGDVGSHDDIDWLLPKVGTNTEGELAWQAALRIFQRSDAVVLQEWVGKLESNNTAVKLSDGQTLTLLQVAERKATGENNSKMLNEVRRRLAHLHYKRGEFEQSAAYWGMLRQATGGAEQEEAILAELLGVFLRWPNLEAMVQLVSNRLLEKDLGPDDVMVVTIDSFLADPNGSDEPNVILQALEKIEPVEPRPMWREQVEKWAGQIGRISGPNDQ